MTLRAHIAMNASPRHNILTRSGPLRSRFWRLCAPAVLACAAMLQGPVAATATVEGPITGLNSIQQHRIHFIVPSTVTDTLSSAEIESRLVKYVDDLKTLFAHQTVRRFNFNPPLDITYANEWPADPINLNDPKLFERDYDINVVLKFGIPGHTSMTIDDFKATHVNWHTSDLLDRDNPVPGNPNVDGVDRYWSHVITLAHEILHGMGVGGPEYYRIAGKLDNSGVAPTINLLAELTTMPVILPSNAYWQERTDYWSDPMMVTERSGASIAERLQRTRFAELTVAHANSRLRFDVDGMLSLTPDLDHMMIHVTQPDGVSPAVGANVRVWVGQPSSSVNLSELISGITDETGAVELAWSPSESGSDLEGLMMLVKVFPVGGTLQPAGFWLNSNDAVEEFLLRDQTDMTVHLALETATPRPVLNQIAAFQSVEDAPFVLTHAALLAASDASDPQGLPIQFRIERFATGQLTKNGQPVATHATLLGPGESLVWTPPAHRHGIEFPALTVRAHNGFSSSDKAIGVRVTLIPMPDAPILRNQTATLTEDASIELEADADDPDGSVPVLVVTTPPQHGQLSVLHSTNYSSFLYVPHADYNGVDSFAYVAQGASAVSAAATVTFTITAVTDLPVLANASVNLTGFEDIAQTHTVSNLLAAAGASSADGRQLFMRVTSLGSGVLTRDGAPVALNSLLIGTAVLTWKPLLNAIGTQSAFTFVASDGLANTQTESQLLVQLTPVNDAPTFAMPAAISMNEDGTLCVPLSNVGPGGGADETGQALSFSMLTSNYPVLPNGPQNLTVSGSGANRCLNVTPAANASGVATITLTLADNAGGLNHLLTQISTITVTNVNDAPTYASGSGTFTSTGIYTWARLLPNLAINDRDVGDAISCRFTGGLPGNVEITTASGSHTSVSATAYYPLATFKTFWIVKRSIFSGGTESRTFQCRDSAGATTAPVTYTVVAS